MPSHVHFLHQTWLQLRFLPVSPLAQLAPERDAATLDALLARVGVFRPGAPALPVLDRMPQLRGYLALRGRGPVSRFCDGSFRTLHAAASLATCLAEMVHHHGRALTDGAEPAGAIRAFEVLSLKLTGRLVDLRQGNDDLHRPGDYRPAQAYGARLVSDGEPGAVFRSVRRQDGERVTLFQAGPVRACTLKTVVTLRWDGQRLG